MFQADEVGSQRETLGGAKGDARVQLTDLSPQLTDAPDARTTGNPPQSNATRKARSPERACV